MKISLLMLFTCYSGLTGSINNPVPKRANNKMSVRDTKNPLILTPYIEIGNITFARNLARVVFTENMGIKSYSGFFTVNEKQKSNQFFWYFPPTATNATDASVILWLQGGPGSSSLFGLFAENGPIETIDGKFRQRKYHWALDHHVIYIDNPVGSGFSFTDTEGYARDEIQIGAELYLSLLQFFTLFPDLKQKKFFIAGESYAGKYAPALGYTIHRNNINSLNDKINLKGLAIGNGFCDPVNQLEYGKYLYQLGLLDMNQLKVFQNYERKCITYIKNRRWDEAFDCFNLLTNGSQSSRPSLFHNFTGITSNFNFLHFRSQENDYGFIKLLNTPAVRIAIHVGNQPYHSGFEVEKHLKYDFMQSVAPWITELLNNYEILFFNGQLDVIVAYPLTVNFLQKLPYVDAEKYKIASRHIWRVDGDVAGYVKTAGKLTEILVRNAGHMIMLDQPKWALDMITRFTHGIPFH